MARIKIHAMHNKTHFHKKSYELHILFEARTFYGDLSFTTESLTTKNVSLLLKNIKSLLLRFNRNGNIVKQYKIPQNTLSIQIKSCRGRSN